MQHAAETVFRQTKLTGWAKALRLSFSVCFLALCITLLIHPDATARHSGLGLALSVTLLLVGLYDVLWVFRQRLYWNEHEIFDGGVFWSGKRHSWTNLNEVATSMQRRTSLLGFGKISKVKVYWGYAAHREIIELAERKLTENA